MSLFSLPSCLTGKVLKNSFSHTASKVCCTLRLSPTAVVLNSCYVWDGNCCRFDLYIFYKSIGWCFRSQVLKTATVGIMLILNDHVCTYTHFVALAIRTPTSHSPQCPVGNLDSHNFFFSLPHLCAISLTRPVARGKQPAREPGRSPG